MKENKKPKKTESPHGGHRERMRNRFLKGGLDAFADHEIIEMLLYYGIPRQNTNEIAHKVYREFGSLHELFDATPQQIMHRTGMTENSAVLFSIVPHLFKRYSYGKWDKKIVFNSSKELGEYAKIPFIGKNYECFYMLCFNNNFELKGLEMLEEGTLDAVELHPRKVVDLALINRSSYVVLAHNHPSGCKMVSLADLHATTSIMKLLEPFNIELIDHIIIAGEDYISFAENNHAQLAGIRGKK